MLVCKRLTPLVSSDYVEGLGTPGYGSSSHVRCRCCHFRFGVITDPSPSRPPVPLVAPPRLHDPSHHYRTHSSSNFHPTIVSTATGDLPCRSCHCVVGRNRYEPCARGLRQPSGGRSLGGQPPGGPAPGGRGPVVAGLSGPGRAVESGGAHPGPRARASV